ncbi:MAG: mechanosensitive ion channel [Cyanobacterium sp. T60_A2020_053]|nr:mechanosensitive ion channel [Cyanobacterium sp. T60_A2020_053]
MESIINVIEFLQAQEGYQIFLNFIYEFGFFIILLLISFFAGRYTPFYLKIIISKFAQKPLNEFYQSIIDPLQSIFRLAGTLILWSLSLNFIRTYEGLYNLLEFIIDLSLIIITAWLISRLFKQLIIIYGIDLIQKLGKEVDELLLVVETIINVLIGFVAVLAFARRLDINLVGLLASLGIGGIAIAFAAQKTLEQLLGTFVIYLDRPFIVGEYIRLNSGLYGRVESIGLRSTKIRLPGKGTLMILPNSMMANIEIENVTRGKKVMVLLYLDFANTLEDSEEALVQDVVKKCTNALFGIDPDSTRVALFVPENQQQTRARVTFFILGSNESSIKLRKRLLELANDNISQQLTTYGIDFTMQEPTIYVDSPVTL